jgi:hypothetical protein
MLAAHPLWPADHYNTLHHHIVASWWARCQVSVHFLQIWFELVVPGQECVRAGQLTEQNSNTIAQTPDGQWHRETLSCLIAADQRPLPVSVAERL